MSSILKDAANVKGIIASITFIAAHEPITSVTVMAT